MRNLQEERKLRPLNRPRRNFGGFVCGGRGAENTKKNVVFGELVKPTPYADPTALWTANTSLTQSRFEEKVLQAYLRKKRISVS